MGLKLPRRSEVRWFGEFGAAGIAQLVERNLAKVEVAGSSPVARSFGAVAKW